MCFRSIFRTRTAVKSIWWEKAYFFASGPSPNEEDHVFDVFKENSPTVQKRKKHVTQPDGRTTRPGGYSVL